MVAFAQLHDRPYNDLGLPQEGICEFFDICVRINGEVIVCAYMRSDYVRDYGQTIIFRLILMMFSLWVKIHYRCNRLLWHF